MNIILVLIPLSLILVAIAVAAFFWAVRTGQFDDLDTPGWSVLADEHTDTPKSEPEGRPKGKPRERSER